MVNWSERWSFRKNLMLNISEAKKVAEDYRRSRKAEKVPQQLFLEAYFQTLTDRTESVASPPQSPRLIAKSEGRCSTETTCLCWKTCFSGNTNPIYDWTENNQTLQSHLEQQGATTKLDRAETQTEFHPSVFLYSFF